MILDHQVPTTTFLRVTVDILYKHAYMRISEGPIHTFPGEQSSPGMLNVQRGFGIWTCPEWVPMNANKRNSLSNNYGRA